MIIDHPYDPFRVPAKNKNEIRKSGHNSTVLVDLAWVECKLIPLGTATIARRQCFWWLQLPQNCVGCKCWLKRFVMPFRCCYCCYCCCRRCLLFIYKYIRVCAIVFFSFSFFFFFCSVQLIRVRLTTIYTLTLAVSIENHSEPDRLLYAHFHDIHRLWIILNISKMWKICM